MTSEGTVGAPTCSLCSAVVGEGGESACKDAFARCDTQSQYRTAQCNARRQKYAGLHLLESTTNSARTSKVLPIALVNHAQQCTLHAW
jgi:hypothetical protein